MAKTRLTLAPIVVLALSCRGNGRPEPTPPGPPGPAARSADGGRMDPSRGTTLAPPRLTPWTSRPELAAAAASLRAKDELAAAREVERVGALRETTPADACLLSYVAGRLYFASNDAKASAAAYERAGQEGCSLRIAAQVAAARSHARAGEIEPALALAKPRIADAAHGDDAKLVVADSAWERGQKADATALYESYLVKAPYGSRWVDVTVKIAEVKVALSATEPERAKEARVLLAKVLTQAPKLAKSSGAEALFAKASAADKIAPTLAPDDRKKLADKWLELGDVDRAATEARSVIAESRDDALLCQANIVLSNARSKAKGGGGDDPWGPAITQCDAQPELANALFSGAKSSSSKKRPDEALARYGELEKRFPTHRLADDARLRTALLYKDRGDDARSLDLLGRLPDDYPEGDMRGEALFRVALHHLERGALALARPALLRIAALEPDDRSYSSGGRAFYFLGRVAELEGHRDDAMKHYQRVVELVPVGYYATMARIRLRGIDPDLERKAVSDAVAKEPPDVAELPDVLSSEGALAAESLFAAGDIEAGRRELSRAGIFAEGAPPIARWVTSLWLADVGAYPEALGFSRVKGAAFYGHAPEASFRLAWEAAYPRAYEARVAEESMRTNVPKTLIWGIGREESSFIADVKSPANAYGVMQLIPSTAKLVGASANLPYDEAHLKDPDVSIALGARLLAKLRAQFKSDALAAAAYNAGGGAVDRWLGQKKTGDLDLFVELIPYEETRNYVKRVLASESAYAYLYDRAAFDAGATRSLVLGP